MCQKIKNLNNFLLFERKLKKSRVVAEKIPKEELLNL